jgi:hypothetical protein
MVAHFESKYNEGLLHRYLELYYRYSDHIHRITDTIEIEDGTLRRSLTVDLTIPDRPNTGPDQPNVSLIPLMRGRRGRLFDNLDVSNGAGDSLSVLAQRENKFLSALLLETEFARALSEADIAVEQLDEVWRIGAAIARIPYLSPKAGRRVVSKCLEGEGTVLESHGVSTENLSDLRKLAEFLCDRFMTTTEVEGGPLDKLIVKYSYDSKYRDDPQYVDAGSGTDFSTRMRNAFGQSPYSFRVRIPLAFVAQSYHFRMDAPSNSYCAVQNILVECADPGGGPGSTRLCKWVPPRKVQARQTQSPASGYAHLYVHGLNETDHFPIFARVIFYEVPPGSVGTAAVVSAATSLALATVAALGFEFMTGPSDGVSVASLVVALPATVAFWLQPSSDRHELLMAPLSSRVGLLVSGALAYLGALLLIVVEATRPHTAGWQWLVQAALGVFAIGSIACSISLFRKWKQGLDRLRCAQKTRHVTT